MPMEIALYHIWQFHELDLILSLSNNTKHLVRLQRQAGAMIISLKRNSSILVHQAVCRTQPTCGYRFLCPF